MNVRLADCVYTGSAERQVVGPRDFLQRGLAVSVPAALLLMTGCVQPAIAPPRGPLQLGLVRVDHESARVTNIGPIRGYGGRDNSFIHCFELVVASLGRPIPYEDLMGLSGAAFRLQVRIDTWDAAGPDPLVGYDCVAPLMAATGFDYQVYCVRPENESEVQQLRRDIMQSIEQRLPVLASNVYPPDWGIIVGYQDRGRNWLVRAYSEPARAADQLARDWPDAVVILSQPKPLTDMRPAYMASIQRAVAMQDTAFVGGYALGRAAYNYWREQLLRAADRSYLQPNAWTYVSLIDARTAASAYLRKLAPLLPAHQAALNSAADLYARQVRVLVEQLPSVQFPSQAPVGLPTAETRRRQIAALQDAMDLERQAVDFLKRIK